MMQHCFFFNFRPEDSNENKFRKPIWINNDDDDDDEYSSDFKYINKKPLKQFLLFFLI